MTQILNNLFHNQLDDLQFANLISLTKFLRRSCHEIGVTFKIMNLTKTCELYYGLNTLYLWAGLCVE